MTVKKKTKKAAPKRKAKTWKAPPLTLAMLVNAEACREARVMFRRRFGNGGAVTLERVLEATNEVGGEAFAHFTWGRDNFLGGSQRMVYDEDLRVAAANNLRRDGIYYAPGTNSDDRQALSDYRNLVQALAFFKAWHTKP